MITIQEIQDKKQFGDMVIIAKILRTTPDVVRMSLKRPDSIRHHSVLAAFDKLLSDRKALENNKQKQ